MTNHACHNATNGMMAGADSWCWCVPMLIVGLTIQHQSHPKQHSIIKYWENGENGKMTPATLDIARLTPFSPILGKWESGESVGKMDDYHTCHDTTNGMMAGADSWCWCVPMLIVGLTIQHQSHPKQHSIIKYWENGENGKMTPATLDIARLTPFSPILGKWESGESVGKMDDYHTCHDTTNGMMAGGSYPALR